MPLASAEPMDDGLRARVIQKIRAGRLPCQPPSRTWAGPSHGTACGACDDGISPGDIEYLVVFGAGAEVVMHLGCYHVWDQECRQTLGAEPAAGGEQ